MHLFLHEMLRFELFESNIYIFFSSSICRVPLILPSDLLQFSINLNIQLVTLISLSQSEYLAGLSLSSFLCVYIHAGLYFDLISFNSCFLCFLESAIHMFLLLEMYRSFIQKESLYKLATLSPREAMSAGFNFDRRVLQLFVSVSSCSFAIR